MHVSITQSGSTICSAPSSPISFSASRHSVFTFFASWCGRDVAAARCKRGEDWIEMFHSFGFAADHHAIAALKTPDAAAGADVDIVDAFCGQLFGAANSKLVSGMSRSW